METCGGVDRLRTFGRFLFSRAEVDLPSFCNLVPLEVASGVGVWAEAEAALERMSDSKLEAILKSWLLGSSKETVFSAAKAAFCRSPLSR